MLLSEQLSMISAGHLCPLRVSLGSCAGCSSTLVVHVPAVRGLSFCLITQAGEMGMLTSGCLVNKTPGDECWCKPSQPWFTGALNGGGTQPSSTPRQTFRSCLIIMVDEREEDPGAVDEMNLMSRPAVP